MQIIEAASHEEEKLTLSSANEARIEGWKASAIAADIATLGSGTILAALVNVVLIFLIPRLISVEDYGYWRLFALYAGYVGFFHLGFADGALLRWAGRPLSELRQEILPSLKFLFWQQVLFLVPLCLILRFLLPEKLRFVGVAVVLYAVVFNVITLLQFGLQGARVFRPVAISLVLGPTLFLGFILLWSLGRPTDFREVIVSYSLASSLVLGFLLFQTRPWQARRPMRTPTPMPMQSLVKDYLLSGWPIVVSNTGVGVILYADRLAVSWAAKIQDFAQYSLAASAMAVPITAIQACSKVFFSHLARLSPDGRKRVYGTASRTLLLAWTLLLPYYFALDVSVRQFLPRYIPSLEFARVLLLGIPFLAGIQILHMSFAYLHGKQIHFLIRTVAVLAVSLGLTSLVAFHARSLKAVAIVQVIILGTWWLFNEWTLRDLTGETLGDWTKSFGVFALASLTYWMTTLPNKYGVTLSVLSYYACAAVILSVTCRSECRLYFKVLVRKVVE
jgi:O-antigen/teichoic acid export membrane protein